MLFTVHKKRNSDEQCSHMNEHYALAWPRSSRVKNVLSLLREFCLLKVCYNDCTICSVHSVDSDHCNIDRHTVKYLKKKFENIVRPHV